MCSSMPRLVPALWLLALAGCQTDAPARDAGARDLPDDRLLLAEELVHRTGLQTQLLTLGVTGPAVTTVLLGRARDEQGNVTPGDRAHAERVGQQLTATVDRVAVDAAAKALAQLPVAQLQAALAHFRDPRADHIALAEHELATGRGQVRLSDYLAHLRHTPEPAARRAAIEQLISLSRAVDLYTALSVDASAAFATALALPDAPLTEGERTRFVDEARRHLVWRTMFVYRTLDEAHLAFRLGFYGRPAGAFWAGARLAAAQAAIAAVARALRPIRPPNAPGSRPEG